MKVKFFCPRWGSEHLSWDAFFQKAKQEGYDGIEYGIANDTPASTLYDVWNSAARHSMFIIAQHYDTYDADYAKHYDTYAAWLEKMKPFKPVKINSQTGKDFFSFEQNSSLIEAAKTFTKQTGIEVYHETHRNKFSFAAHVTKEYLYKIPSLQITLDASHWVCVAESFLEDQLEALQLAIERTEHIHARVGYSEGPQVTDPRVSEWEYALRMHMNWWDKIAARKKHEGENTVLTITPEFGPYPYLVQLPFTRQPITNQWEVNVFMMQLLKERYG